MSAECPKIPVTWTEGDTLPEIAIIVPLEDGEDFTGSTSTLRLDRKETSAGDVLVKGLIESDSSPGNHYKLLVDWTATDLLAGLGQQATVEILDTAGDLQTQVRFQIDVLPRIA